MSQLVLNFDTAGTWSADNWTRSTLHHEHREAEVYYLHGCWVAEALVGHAGPYDYDVWEYREFATRAEAVAWADRTWRASLPAVAS